MSTPRARSGSDPVNAMNQRSIATSRSHSETLHNDGIETAANIVEPTSSAPEKPTRADQVRRRCLNISGAAIPEPQSSAVEVQGQMIPLERQPGLADKSHKSGSEGVALDPEQSTRGQAQQGVSFRTSEDGEALNIKAEKPFHTPREVESVTSDQLSQNDAGEERVSALGQLSPVQTASIPSIHIHQPSNSKTTLASSSEMQAKTANAVDESISLEHLAAGPGVAINVNSATGSSGTGKTVATAPDDAFAVSGAVNGAKLPGENISHVDVENALVPRIPPSRLDLRNVPAPAATPLVGASKVGRRQRIVRRTRSVVLRKELLTIILGHELAEVVHPQLHQLSNGGPTPADAAEVSTSHSVDGPAEFKSAPHCAKSDEKRRKLDQKISHWDFEATQEKWRTCMNCGQQSSTTAVKKYLRLLIKNEHPELSMVQRYRLAQRQVCRIPRCKCHEDVGWGTTEPTVSMVVSRF